MEVDDDVDVSTPSSSSVAAVPCVSGLPPVPRSFSPLPSASVPKAAAYVTLSANGEQINPDALPGMGPQPVEAYYFSQPGQPSTLMANLATLREKNELCDLELIVEGRSLMVHRCVLAAGIPYFSAMFSSLMLETTKNQIVINDIPFDSLSRLVNFVYTNKICIDSDNVQMLLFAASILQMDSVGDACERFLARFLTTTNCLSIRQFAEQHNCIYLLDNTDEFALTNFTELCMLEEFQQISFSYLKDLVGRSDLNVKSEEQVFEAMVAWVMFNKESRFEHLVELFSRIRLQHIKVRYLVDVVKNHPLIKESRECLDQISDALFEMISPLKDSQLPASIAIGDECISDYAVGACMSTSRPLSPSRLNRERPPRKSISGVIFCAGGRGTAGDPFRTVEAFDWRKGRWIPVPEMTQQRRHVGVVSAHGKLYAIGGHDGHAHLATAERFDPSEGCWRKMKPMNTSRRGIAVATLDSAIYAVGGLDDQTCFGTVERYDIELDTWAEVASMQVHRGGVGVTALGKFLFAIGGNDGNSSLDSCERFDPLLNRWSVVKRMTNRRAGAGVCVLDGYLYAVGGFDDNAPLSTCERYNSADDTWEPLANMSCPRGGVGVAAMGGLVYAIGGHDGNRYLNTVEAFDPRANQWAPVADIKECRAGAGVAWANCRIDDLLRWKQESGCAPSAGSQCI